MTPDQRAAQVQPSLQPPQSPQPPQPPLLDYPQSVNLELIGLGGLFIVLILIITYGGYKLWQHILTKQHPTDSIVTAEYHHQQIIASQPSNIAAIHHEFKLVLKSLLNDDPQALAENEWHDWLKQHRHTLGSELTDQITDHLNTTHQLIYQQQSSQPQYQPTTSALVQQLIAHFKTQRQQQMHHHWRSHK